MSVLTNLEEEGLSLPPVIAVPQIQFRISKEHRRRIGLASLYRAPEAVRLPLAGLEFGEEALLHHSVELGIRSASRPAERVLMTSLDVPLLIGGVTITSLPEQEVRVEFAYTGLCGAPAREWARQTFLMRPGEWVQVRYNGRHAPFYNDYWYYEKMTVNVGVWLEPRETLFLDTEPIQRYSLISELK